MSEEERIKKGKVKREKGLEGWVNGWIRVGSFKSLARFLHSAMPGIASVEMTRVEIAALITFVVQIPRLRPRSCHCKNGGCARDDKGGRALVGMTGVSALRLK